MYPHLREVAMESFYPIIRFLHIMSFVFMDEPMACPTP